MDSTGRCEVRRIELHAKRDVRCIEGEMNTLLRAESLDGRDDFIKVRLLDKGAILDPIGKLRDVYPNVMDLERLGLMNEQVGDQTIRRDPRDNDVLALFTDFYLEVTGEPLTEQQASAFSVVVNKILQSEREATS
jgi:exonuclease SbcD